jgi:hypothetical protein
MAEPGPIPAVALAYHEAHIRNTVHSLEQMLKFGEQQ